ncbi:MAG: oligosaccharide flippase family protein [Solirubrobacteraceae bacterium]
MILIATPMATAPLTPSSREVSVEAGIAQTEEDHTGLRRITAGTARMAAAAGVRQVLATGALAITAAIVARCLGPHNFGVYSGGTAAFNLCLLLCDFGFSIVLVRELSKRPEEQERLMGAALSSQVLWSGVLTMVLVVLGVAAGGTRGRVMLVLTPAVALYGLGVTRQIFSVRFRATPLFVMDVSTTLLQCAVMAALAVLHAPVVILALNLSFWTCLTGFLALSLARRQVGFTAPTRHDLFEFVRTAVPLGVASVLASLYFSIDLTLLGWLVVPRALGHYAVATRLLSVVVMIPGLVMVAGIPGLARASKEPAQLSRFAATLAKWIAMTALPLGAGIAVFARPIVLVMFGHAYLAAVPLVRILMIAGLLALASNVLGIVMSTLGIVRQQILFNTISLTVNVAGNIVLVPRFGVVASAWLTVGSEAIVASYGLVTLSGRISYAAILRATWRPAAAVAVAGSVGWLLGGAGVLAITAAVAIFLMLTVVAGLTDPAEEWSTVRGLLRSRRRPTDLRR